MGCTQSKRNEPSEIQNPAFSGGGGSNQGSGKSCPLTPKEIQMRIEAPAKTQLLDLAGVSYRYAWMSQRGYYPEAPDKDNQDAFYIEPSYGKTTDQQSFFGVYDGHGRDGHHCARYARDHLGRNILDKLDRIPIGSMNSKTIKQALNVAHYLTNEAMHTDKRFDDSLSGTTAISILFRGRTMFVSNVGDSRAIIVSASEDGRLVAKPMSSDQTPYRKDERERIKKFGARVLSMDQIEGIEPIHENWGDLNLGEDIDEGGDPPRVWSPNGDYPGTAFTRSLGDLLAEECGVIPEPEILEREVLPNDRYIVIASDGVFEFLTNQMVADMLARYDDPLEACKAVVAASYDMWLQYEVRTDDITIIALYINDVKKSASFDYSSSFYAGAGSVEGARSIALSGSSASSLNASALLAATTTTGSAAGTASQSAQAAAPPMSVPVSMSATVTKGAGPDPSLALMEARPVRRVMSREKRKHMIQLRCDSIDEDELNENEIESLMTPKSSEDQDIILSALRNNFLFQHLNAAQRNAVVGVMQPVLVKTGDWVIRQGEDGDRFYVVDSGRFEVRVRPGGVAAEDKAALGPGMTEREKERVGGNVVHVYESGVDLHPGFGELSLMYGKPRAASVIALTDGKLWALDRRVFRRVVLRPDDYRREILRTLKKVELFKCLSLTQMQRLIDLLNEGSYNAGDFIIRQGEPGDVFYLLVSGNADCTINSPDGQPAKVVMQLKEGSYFGERALLESKPRAANVIAVTDSKVLYIDKAAFEEVLGPLAQIIDEDRARREALAALRLAGPQDISELDLQGVVLTDQLGVITMAHHAPSQKDITLRSFLLTDVVSNNLHDTVTRYLEAIKVDVRSSEIVPKPLTMLRQSNALHLVFPCALIADMASFVRSHSEGLASQPQHHVYSFACIVAALERLHDAGIVYRGVQPESIHVDALGRVVLMDYRFCKTGLHSPMTKAFTLCGASDYLSPEQISQTGHSFPVDLWGLGVLLFEVLCGSHPFSSASEVATYSKISSFGTKLFPALKFPDSLSAEGKALINQLLVPTPEARIGAGPNGFFALKKHPYFKDIVDWEDLHKVPGADAQPSPLFKFAQEEKKEILSEAMDTKLVNSFSLPCEADLSWLDA